MEYIIISFEDLLKLLDAVREKLADGWEPQGGVSVAMSFDTNDRLPRYVKYHFAQAMVRTTK